MKNTLTQPPDAIDKEWLDDICDHCIRTAICARYRDCCPVPRVRRLVPRSQVPDSELLAALDEARQFCKEER